MFSGIKNKVVLSALKNMLGVSCCLHKMQKNNEKNYYGIAYNRRMHIVYSLAYFIVA